MILHLRVSCRIILFNIRMRQDAHYHCSFLILFQLPTKAVREEKESCRISTGRSKILLRQKGYNGLNNSVPSSCSCVLSPSQKQIEGRAHIFMFPGSLIVKASSLPWGFIRLVCARILSESEVQEETFFECFNLCSHQQWQKHHKDVSSTQIKLEVQCNSNQNNHRDLVEVDRQILKSLFRQKGLRIAKVILKVNKERFTPLAIKVH